MFISFWKQQIHFIQIFSQHSYAWPNTHQHKWHSIEGKTRHDKIVKWWIIIVYIINIQRLLIHWGRDEIDAISKTTFLNAFSGRNENVWTSLKISLKLVPKVQINNIPALVQVMAWRRPGDKPLSEPMMVNLLTQICASWPQWVNGIIIASI